MWGDLGKHSPNLYLTQCSRWRNCCRTKSALEQKILSLQIDLSEETQMSQTLSQEIEKAVRAREGIYTIKLFCSSFGCAVKTRSY